MSTNTVRVTRRMAMFQILVRLSSATNDELAAILALKSISYELDTAPVLVVDKADELLSRDIELLKSRGVLIYD